LAAETLEALPSEPRAASPKDNAWAAGLAPVLLAGIALSVDRFMPDAQTPAFSWVNSLPAWRQPYPVLLYGLAGLSLIFTVLEFLWRPLRPWVRHHGPLVAGAIGLTIVWNLLTLKSDFMELPFFPGPNAVFAGLVDDWEILLESAAHSLRLLLTGYVIGVANGIVIGVLIGWYSRVRYWGMPLIKWIGPIPATALVPLAMTISSNLFITGAALIAYAVSFPVIQLTVSGIANVRLSYLDVAKTLGAKESYLIFRVAIPAALPHIFIGVFIGLLVSFLTLIVAEVGVSAGLGWYIKWKQGYGEYDKIFASLIVMSVFFSSILTLLFKLRDWLLSWQKGVIKW
jgi:NitT/TauT family transport system permease protein